MKIAIIGYSGSGKSTLAKKLSERFKIPVLYLDTINIVNIIAIKKIIWGFFEKYWKAIPYIAWPTGVAHITMHIAQEITFPSSSFGVRICKHDISCILKNEANIIMKNELAVIIT